jgi:predicted DNA-binding protein YlxM (UPF0122 family)
MSAPRKLTDEQCKELAEWFKTLRGLGSVHAKAKELGISKPALYDAIARGEGRMTSATRHKLSELEIEQLVDEVSRGTLTA